MQTVRTQLVHTSVPAVLVTLEMELPAQVRSLNSKSRMLILITILPILINNYSDRFYIQ